MRDFKCYLILSTLITVIGSGSNCSSFRDNSTLDNIRIVHVNVRSAFVEADDVLSLYYEEAGDECISVASSMDEWRECMQSWDRVEMAISLTRELLATAELVYESIEAGQSNTSNFAFIYRQILMYTRTICRILDTLNISHEIIDTVSGLVETVCRLVGCEYATE